MKPVLTLGLFSAPGGQLEEALVALGMSEGQDVVHQFEPKGTSWVRFSASGRVVLHTWPEKGVVSVDVWSHQAVDLAHCLEGLGWTPVKDGT